MFTPGTPIVVINSALKDGIGPRKGSLGYVIYNNESTVFESNYVAKCVTVAFHRFGFEQKHRYEKRLVVNLLPLTGADANPKQELIALQRLFDNPTQLPKIQAEISHKIGKATVMLMAPLLYNNVNLLECDSNTLDIWIRSSIYSVKSVVHSILNGLPTLTNVANIRMNISDVHHINDLLHNRDRMSACIDELLVDKKQRQRHILLIRGLLILQQTTYMHRRTISNVGIPNAMPEIDFLIMSKIVPKMDGPHHTSYSDKELHSLLYDGMYTQSFEYMKTRFLEDGYATKCIKNIERIKHEIQSLSKKINLSNTSNQTTI